MNRGTSAYGDAGAAVKAEPSRQPSVEKEVGHQEPPNFDPPFWRASKGDRCGLPENLGPKGVKP